MYTYFSEEKRIHFESVLDGTNTNYREDPPEKLIVSRYDPQLQKGIPITGVLYTYQLRNQSLTLPPIIERVSAVYGGGRFQFKIISVTGKYITSLYCDIAGLPKMPSSEEYS